MHLQLSDPVTTLQPPIDGGLLRPEGSTPGLLVKRYLLTEGVTPLLVGIDNVPSKVLK